MTTCPFCGEVHEYSQRECLERSPPKEAPPDLLRLAIELLRRAHSAEVDRCEYIHHVKPKAFWWVAVDKFLDRHGHIDPP